MLRRVSVASILTMAVAIAPAPARSQPAEGGLAVTDETGEVRELSDAQGTAFAAGLAVTVPSGEVRGGDLYAAGESIRVDGRLAGDLVAGAQRMRVDGQVDGDLFAAARTIDLRGPLGDSARVVADQVTVNATIDGDLIAGGNRVQILDGAVIRGGVAAAASSVELDGVVEENLRVAAGEIIVRGTVRGDVNVIADRLDLDPGARIEGDLDYRTRIPLSAEATALVGGEVRYQQPVDDDDGGGVVFWGWQTGAAMFAGLLGVALFRRLVGQLVAAVAGEPTLGALLGFGAFLIVPVGAAVVMVTVVGLPVGIIAVLLFGMAVYVAKLPIAVWAGGQLLARAGRTDPSPYAAMALGVLVLYLLFAIPWVGGLFWLVATCLGLGAMVLSGRRYLTANGA